MIVDIIIAIRHDQSNATRVSRFLRHASLEFNVKHKSNGRIVWNGHNAGCRWRRVPREAMPFDEWASVQRRRAVLLSTAHGWKVDGFLSE